MQGYLDVKYRAQVPDTYGIHESSSTLCEVKGDAGPAVAEMLLDRIKELENLLGQTLAYMVGPTMDADWDMYEKIQAALNKEQK